MEKIKECISGGSAAIIIPEINLSIDVGLSKLAKKRSGLNACRSVSKEVVHY